MANEELEKRAAVRDEKAEYEDKLKKHEQQDQETVKKPKSREPKEPEKITPNSVI